ncbi:MAG: tRNA (adenosine(37)-N6)-threonylcarbamoyltransferase complex ATPase subunit type 1 TsaE [Planctomycetaceae bacterium]|jgi:tRNA threonylcarbamoyladenosine biosynthesis protein TsaE|nr:tRNA (adenosine(37)-N6)-threonylcarbamoyltransferase complex ATPase subunit type 1 TsaE [Planctomycetaceae bacterium]
MSELLFEVLDLSGTELVCRFLAELLPDGAVVSLEGTLGAGKTRFVQGVAKYLNVEEGVVTSPTFVLLREYEGDRQIYHFDAYRLANETEFRQLDPDDYFERGGITFIEWGDKFPQILPNERLQIRIEIINDTARKFKFTSFGNQFDKIIESLKTQINLHFNGEYEK